METEIPRTDSEAVRFLQFRVARFATTSGLAGLLLAAIWICAAFLFDHSIRNLSWPGYALHVCGCLVFLAVAAACQKPSPALSYIHKLESSGLFLACTCFISTGAFLRPDSRPEEIVPYVLFFAVIARSIYVPSRGGRTLALSAAIALIHLLFSAAFYPKKHFSWSGSGLPLSPTAEVVLGAISLTVGWLFAIFLATAASEVIYGLRKEIGEARRLGPYTLGRKIGEGGMGEVYEAGHAMLRRRTAVKLLLPTKASEEDIRRFEREVRLAARLCHPNTITIYDYGRTRAGVFYYAMELLEGASLERLVEFAGRVPPGRAAGILYAVAGALHEAHGLGLIHRDVKPANILLCRHGGGFDVPKLVDFGLVKSIRKGATSPLSTEADVMLGTPYYMSPEAIRNPQTVDARSDLYSLGAVAFFLVTGTHVFNGEKAFEVCERHVHQEPDTISERLDEPFSPDFEKLIGDCLEKSPADRPQSAAILRARLRELADFGTFGEDAAVAWWHERGNAFLTRRATEDRTGLLAWAEEGLASASSEVERD